MIEKIQEKYIERFWERINKTDSCWLWTGTVDKDSYGKLSVTLSVGNYTDVRVHRLSWMIHFGNIPENLCVCHKCDTPLCVNPKHLFIGTKQDNDKDKLTKNRQAKGERNGGGGKLTEQQVKDIISLPKNLTNIFIAEQYAVSSTLIRKIRNGSLWKYLPRPSRKDNNAKKSIS